MAQHDVYVNTNPETNKLYPYLLDIQSNTLGTLPTRVVIPLVRASNFEKIVSILNPRLVIDQTEVIVSTAQLASVDSRILGARVCSIDNMRNEIVAALDLLISVG